MTPVKVSIPHSAGRVAALSGPASRHRFGSHLSIAGGMHNAIDAALRLGFDTVQVFVKNQRQWRAAPFKPDDLARWFERLATPAFGPPVAHATYLINLASADAALRRRSRAAFAEELMRCDALRIPHLVIHPGAAGEQRTEHAIARVANCLNQVYDRNPGLQAMTLLETTAGQGTSLGRSFEQLGAILRLIEHAGRVGVCVDTCHVFAAGYDIRTAGGYAAMIKSLAEHVGIERVRCWHLNDSRGGLGSRLDRHEHIGRGRIGAAGFRNVLTDERFVGLPMILETPKEQDARGRPWDVLNLHKLRALARPVAKRREARGIEPVGA
jgi:deoxyribonuclease-4